MTARLRVLDVDLDAFPAALEGLEGYAAIQALVRLHGAPLGMVRLPVQGGRCSGDALRDAVLRELWWPITHHLLADALAGAPASTAPDVDAVVRAPHPAGHGRQPAVTVAVCTRDRTADLAICLEGLSRLQYPHLDLLVVDNAPTSDDTERLVRTHFPQVRYVREPRRAWTGRATVRSSRPAGRSSPTPTTTWWSIPGGSPPWLPSSPAIPRSWPSPAWWCHTSLETQAQQLFEQYGGFGRGYVEQWFSIDRNGESTRGFHGAGRFGTGANMAYRRSVFDRVGLFDPALDVGTVTNGGGDLEMFFRVLKEGHTLVYVPSAIVRHRHRREYARLRTQLANNGIGLYSHFVRTGLVYPEESQEPAPLRPVVVLALEPASAARLAPPAGRLPARLDMGRTPRRHRRIGELPAGPATGGGARRRL